jgi:hypothetical protein
VSHVTCPKCGSNDHITGYGLACGPMGAYTLCEGCDAVLELFPDYEGLSEEHEKRVRDEVEKYLRDLWGDKYDSQFAAYDEAQTKEK